MSEFHTLRFRWCVCGAAVSPFVLDTHGNATRPAFCFFLVVKSHKCHPREPKKVCQEKASALLHQISDGGAGEDFGFSQVVSPLAET